MRVLMQHCMCAGKLECFDFNAAPNPASQEVGNLWGYQVKRVPLHVQLTCRLNVLTSRLCTAVLH